MKKHLRYYIVLGILSIALISGTLYSSSSPGKKTGSPLDGSSCVSCHTGSAVEAKTGWITSDIPATGWTPETTYTFTVIAEDATAAKIGFEITAENSTSKVGTFVITDDTRTMLTNAKKAVTHKDAGNTPTNGVVSWSFQWTSPDVDSDEITFFAAFNAADGNRSTSGDRIFTSTYKVSQNQATTSIKQNNVANNAVYPNPAYGFVMVQSEKTIEKIVITDITGRTIKTIKGNNETLTKVDLFELDKGNYFVKTLTSNGEFIRKVQLN